MFLNLRPDSNSVWKNAEVIKCLPDYYETLFHGQSVRYLLAKQLKTELNIKNEQNLDILWEEHANLKKKFNSFFENRKKKQDNVNSANKNDSKYNYLQLKAEIAKRIMKKCIFCEHRCEIDRSKQTGICGVGDSPLLSSGFLHWGEESVLVPSGTLFFCGCNFKCQFCQNYSISQKFANNTNECKIVNEDILTAAAESLTKKGARNINWVGGSPTPNLAFILQSLVNMKSNITQVWNSNFYMTKESMELLVDIIDVWLPDFKYWDNEVAYHLSKIKNYREVLTRNLLQVKNEGSNEIIIRHLVMPNRVDGDTIPILKWLADNIPAVLVNIMAQYRPSYHIPYKKGYEQYNRKVTKSEMQKAYDEASKLNLEWRSVS